jgi:hypothetical protein
MFTDTLDTTPRRVLAILLLTAITLVACAPPQSSDWVSHDDDLLDQPAFIYFVLESRTPEGEVSSGYSDSDDQCRLLPLKKYDTTDPHGKHHYKSLTAGDAIWDRCWDYNSEDKPPLVITSIPPEFADQMGVTIPNFPTPNNPPSIE